MLIAAKYLTDFLTGTFNVSIHIYVYIYRAYIPSSNISSVNLDVPHPAIRIWSSRLTYYLVSRRIKQSRWDIREGVMKSVKKEEVRVRVR